MMLRKFSRAAFGIALVLALGACASTPPTDPAARAAWEEKNDPYEEWNRRVFAFNMKVDRNIGRPVARGYRRAVPPFVRDRIRNVSDHIASPVTFINDILQGKGDRAAETGVRFFVNTVAGMGGLFDVAGQYGLRGHKEDFGQTLAVWGFREGPYLMLPLLGPSNRRDLVGLIVDNFSNPIDYGVRTSTAARIVFGLQGAAGGLDNYARLQPTLISLERNSIDFYAAMRSLYRQNRESEIKDGKVDAKDIPVPGEDEE